jgi:hypothetical protein
MRFEWQERKRQCKVVAWSRAPGVTPERGEKLTTVGGNFFTDPMPKADAYLLMNIIHGWPDAESTKILSAISRDMPKHARVLIIETVVPPTPGPHSLEGTRHRHDGAPRRHGAHSGRIWRLGLEICPAIETYRGDDESIFNFGNGGRLETSKSLSGIAHQLGQLPISRRRSSSRQPCKLGSYHSR